MPVQSFKIDGTSAGSETIRTRFHPKALFLYSTWQPGDQTTDNDNDNGASLSFCFANVDEQYGTTHQSWSPIAIAGQGTTGSRMSYSETVFGSDITWDSCAFTLNSNIGNSRIGGLAFGGDNLETYVGQLTLTDDGDPVTVSGLPFEPQVVMFIRCGGAHNFSDSYDGQQGIGVSNGTDEWFCGDFVVPAGWGGGAPGLGVGYITSEYYDTGCVTLSESQYYPTDNLIYSCAMETDGFTLTAVDGTLGTTYDTYYYYLALYDPDGDFNIGTTSVNGSGEYEVSGLTSPEAVLVTSINREVGRYTHDEFSWMTDDTGNFPLWTLGTDDKWPYVLGRYAASDTPGISVAGLRYDPDTGYGAYALILPNLELAQILIIGAGGTESSSSGSIAGMVNGDELKFVADGDDYELFWNEDSICSITSTYNTVSGYPVFLLGGVEEVSYGGVGASSLIDDFERANSLDVNTSWETSDWGPFGETPGTEILGIDSGVMIPVSGFSFLAYWNDNPLEDSELVWTVHGWSAAEDSGRNNVWMHYVQSWDGFSLWSFGYMGGSPHDTLELWTRTGDSGDYPYGPYIEMDFNRILGYGVKPTGWAGNVTSDTGNHKVGWITFKTGPASETPFCLGANSIDTIRFRAYGGDTVNDPVADETANYVRARFRAYNTGTPQDASASETGGGQIIRFRAYSPPIE